MNNVRTFSATVSLKTCAESLDIGHGLTSRKESGVEALEALAYVLRAYGMDVDIEQTSKASANIKIRHPERWEAESVRVRNPYGRPRKQKVSTVSLEWLDSHTVEEGMEALGVSRRTYYRRLKEMRESAKS